MHIFWRAPAEFCWHWSFMYSGMTFDLKNAPAKFMMQSCEFFPPPTAAAMAADAATITARLTP
jgi:hypothetical protein